MTNSIRILSIVAAAGGAAWLAKFLVILASDGAESGAADSITAILYVGGVALMCVGAASVTLRAARGRATAALAMLAAPVVAIAVYTIVDAIAKPAVGDAGPSWLADEAGIAATGLLWLAIGVVSTRRAEAPAVALAA